MGYANSMALVYVILISFPGFAQQAAKGTSPPTAKSTVAPVAPRTSITQKAWGVGLIGWPEKVKITDEFGVNHDANVQFYTPSFHFTFRNIRAKYGFIYEGYAFFGKADIQNEPGSSLSYFQKRVGVYGVGGLAGIFTRPASKQISVGVSAPVQYRVASWTSPPNGGAVNNKSLFALGLMLDLRWRITEDMGINQRIGQFLGQPGSLWMFDLEWTL